MRHVDFLFRRTFVLGCEVDVARQFVIAIDSGNDGVGRATQTGSGLLHIAYAAHQLSVEGIQINVVIAIALAGQHQVFVGNVEIGKDILVDVLVNLVLDNLLTER